MVENYRLVTKTLYGCTKDLMEVAAGHLISSELLIDETWKKKLDFLASSHRFRSTRQWSKEKDSPRLWSPGCSAGQKGSRHFNRWLEGSKLPLRNGSKFQDGWDTEPFELTEIDGKLFGRGSTDDKGPVICWLHAIRTLQENGIDLPVNLKVGYFKESRYFSKGNSYLGHLECIRKS